MSPVWGLWFFWAIHSPWDNWISLQSVLCSLFIRSKGMWSMWWRLQVQCTKEWVCAERSGIPCLWWGPWIPACHSLCLWGTCGLGSHNCVCSIHRYTLLVMANGQELSFLIRVSLVITLQPSMLFTGNPYNWSCMARQISLVLGFSLCLSCILGKTISLFSAYRISKSKTPLISIHPLYWKITVLTSVLVGIGI